MGLNIKNQDTCRLARELAERTGETMTEAITNALRERLERLEAWRRDDQAKRRERVRALLVDLPTEGVESSGDHADLYDEYGLPS